MATPRRRDPRGHRRPSFWATIPKVRLAIISVCALAATWLTVAVGVAGTQRVLRPDLALAIMPMDAGARVRSAELMLVQAASQPGAARTAAIRAAGQAAREALKREPGMVAAWRLLAADIGLRGQPQLAIRLFYWAERLSRRDRPTQLALIQERVAHDDIPGALRHYDIALRTHLDSPDLLFPILVGATSQAQIIRPLATVLARNPPWRTNFLWALVGSAPSDENLVRLFELIARRDAPFDRPLAQALVQRLVSRGKFAEAGRALRLISGTGPTQAGLRNGGFEGTNEVPPFDWQLEEGSDLRAEQGAIDNREGQVLRLHAAGGRVGPVARQLLTLPPGQYSLSAVAGPAPGAAPAELSWTVTCARAGVAPLHIYPVPPAGGPAAHRTGFQVPASCPSQWLSLVIRAGDGDGESWVDNVVISRR